MSADARLSLASANAWDESNASQRPFAGVNPVGAAKCICCLVTVAAVAFLAAKPSPVPSTTAMLWPSSSPSVLRRPSAQVMPTQRPLIRHRAVQPAVHPSRSSGGGTAFSERLIVNTWGASATPAPFTVGCLQSPRRLLRGHCTVHCRWGTPVAAAVANLGNGFVPIGGFTRR